MVCFWPRCMEQMSFLNTMNTFKSTYLLKVNKSYLSHGFKTNLSIFLVEVTRILRELKREIFK